ncbi:MAG: hypothetical protein NT166_11785 [Candidatus Aminicenantes bacterium]|nr:hypothetical protein [Candidatus Aminicenantes bacterium]
MVCIAIFIPFEKSIYIAAVQGKFIENVGILLPEEEKSAGKMTPGVRGKKEKGRAAETEGKRVRG